MKIAICASIDFTPEIKAAADMLIARGHSVEIPLTSQRIIEGGLELEEFKKVKEQHGDRVFREDAKRKIDEDVIRLYYKKIKDCDAILVLNLKKKDVDGYIGGNTFLEMGFAYVLEKKIYLLHEIPDMSYKDELESMLPIILSGDLSKI